MIDVGPLTRQAVKCVNDFLSRADGNWRVARAMWREELDTLPYGPKFKPYVVAVNAAFKEMEPHE